MQYLENQTKLIQRTQQCFKSKQFISEKRGTENGKRV